MYRADEMHRADEAEEFEIARAGHFARHAVSHQEAGRRVGLPVRSAAEDESGS
jgi:hypothetical protein